MPSVFSPFGKYVVKFYAPFSGDMPVKPEKPEQNPLVRREIEAN
jgi:hypothetical protein